MTSLATGECDERAIDATLQKHRRAVTFFWTILIGATLTSLAGNVIHAVLRYVPEVAVKIGVAAVPPVVLLAAVHGIAVAVRAGASGTVYRWAVAAVAAIGVGAFAVSFLALRDLMIAIGYSAYTAWIFPMIIDTAVAVSTLMLVALGDKPVRRKPGNRTDGSATTPPVQGGPRPFRSTSVQAGPTAESRGVVRPVQAVASEDDRHLASALVASKVTTQPIETVVAVLATHREGASTNAVAKATAINYRTAQRIIDGAAEMLDAPAVAS